VRCAQQPHDPRISRLFFLLPSCKLTALFPLPILRHPAALVWPRVPRRPVTPQRHVPDLGARRGFSPAVIPIKGMRPPMARDELAAKADVTHTACGWCMTGGPHRSSPRAAGQRWPPWARHRRPRSTEADGTRAYASGARVAIGEIPKNHRSDRGKSRSTGHVAGPAVLPAGVKAVLVGLAGERCGDCAPSSVHIRGVDARVHRGTRQRQSWPCVPTPRVLMAQNSPR
jgi:hypothetical protein